MRFIKTDTGRGPSDQVYPEEHVPWFVPLVEEGFAKHKITREVIDIYLSDMRESDIDTLILGLHTLPTLTLNDPGIYGRKDSSCESGI